MNEKKSDAVKGSLNGRSLKQTFLRFFMNQSVFLIVLMVIIGIVVSLINPKFLAIQNLFNIILQVSVTGIICVGMGTVLISGNFDLTLGPQISILGIVMALLVTRYSIALTIVSVIVLGLIIGTLNGFLVTRIKAHSFIVTLALATVYTGVALLISGGKYTSLSGRFGFFIGKLFNVIPWPTIVFVIIILAIFVVYRYTKFGRLLFAIGGNAEAAYLSGVKVKLYKVLAFTLAGGLYGVATLVLVSQLGVSYPTTGNAYTLTALAAIVIGGIALQGGKGSALGIFLGTIMFGLINNSLIVTGVNPFWRDVTLGFIILFAVMFSGMITKND
jgi:ribose transport system permease protein